MQPSTDTSVGETVQVGASTLASIQALVRSELVEVGSELHRIVLSDFEMIEEVNEHLLFLQGKLFRPTLLLLSSRVDGEPHEDSRTLAAVVELVHLATLVHDDAVDHSILRRGMPTVNTLWTHQVAIIMGDYLYSRAVTELAQRGHLDALAVLAGAANEMSVGEMRQLTSYDTLDFTEQDYYRLIAAKTASLMSASCEMGSLTGEVKSREQLARFGHDLGMAFQIADDLLDYTGSEAVTGKPTGQDLREHKVTLPLIGALASASEAEEREIRTLFTQAAPSDDDIRKVMGIVAERGGIEYAKGQADHYAGLARASLTGLKEGVAVDALYDAVDYVVDRRR
jgi:octaprenyl-diphosphate synthase